MLDIIPHKGTHSSHCLFTRFMVYLSFPIIHMLLDISVPCLQLLHVTFAVCQFVVQLFVLQLNSLNKNTVEFPTLQIIQRPSIHIENIEMLAGQMILCLF